MKTSHLCGALTVSALLVAGCAANDPNRGAKTGAVIGGVAGLLIGNQVGDDDKDRAIGAAVGALAGAGVGHYMDRQRRAMEEQLADEEEREQLNITEMEGDALRVGVASDATFGFDSAELRADSESIYNRISGVVQDFDNTIIHVVGHTDSQGPELYNQGLSERRAKAVARHMRSQGVDGNRLIVAGRGESEPLASNETEAGREQNRRVDIVIKPVVEGEEGRAYRPPPYLGS